MIRPTSSGDQHHNGYPRYLEDRMWSGVGVGVGMEWRLTVHRYEAERFSLCMANEPSHHPPRSQWRDAPPVKQTQILRMILIDD